MTTALGLASGGWERKIEAPVAISSLFETRSALWTTLIEPFASSPPSLGWTVRQDDSGITMAYQADRASRRFLLVRTDSEASIPDSWVESAPFSTDATVAMIEQRPSDKSGAEYRRLALHGGALFLEPRIDTPAIVRSEQPIDLLEATWNSGTLAVHLIGGGGTTLKTYGARRLLLNGKVYPIPTGLRFIRLPDLRRT